MIAIVSFDQGVIMENINTFERLIALSKVKIVSLDEETGVDGSTRIDTIKSDYKENKFEKADELYLREYDNILKTLLEDTKVLKWRYAGNGMTLQQVGDILGLTRERVRQIEEKELKKLRIMLAANGYMENPYSTVVEKNNGI